jgi:dipeptidyl aminopeptidase/acylaminoacyl peptidase
LDLRASGESGKFQDSSMKPTWWFGCVILAAGLSAAESIPVEDFARPALVNHAQISPDGQYVAFLREDEGRTKLFLTDLKQRTLTHLEPADAKGLFVPKEIREFHWASDRRLVFTNIIWDHMITGVAAVDRDGRQWITITGAGANTPNEDRLFASTIIHRCDDPDQSILMLDGHEARGELRLYPDVVKVNTLTGHYVRVAKNPGNVVGWGADQAGCVRVGITMDGLKFGTIYREREDASWRSFPSLGAERGQIRPLGFGWSDRTLYVVALSPRKRWAVYPYDPTNGTLGDVLVDDPDYDISVPLVGAVLTKKITGVAGVYYVTEKPQVRWFDPEDAARQRAIDRALPHTFNLIASRSRDGQRLLVFAYSDRDPGTYYLFDRADNSLTLVGTRMGWIKPDRMAPMDPIQYAARDGLPIHGYLTGPLGASRQNLPLVVMPHGGPWVRDVWGFDPLVQMLASRGYAVLQMNYRGSTGYGEDFHDKGRREVGRAIQDDIEDGTRWAIASGLADPKRIAIVGASYGGYAALFALGHNPDLYRCGISLSGVTDWVKIYENLADPEYTIAREHWIEQIGNPNTEESFLRSISPVNFADKITAPVLIVQGKEDRIVPPKQARAMLAALEKAGRKPQSLFLADEGHGIRSRTARVEEFQRIEEFLAKNLAP